MTTTQIVESGDQKGEVKSVGGVQYIKAYFASGFTQYTPYVLDQGATLFNPTASAPATNAVANSRVVVPQGDTTTVAGWYWAAFQG
nr:hypothetical protein [Actinomycetota bacterium]